MMKACDGLTHGMWCDAFLGTGGAWSIAPDRRFAAIYVGDLLVSHLPKGEFMKLIKGL